MSTVDVSAVQKLLTEDIYNRGGEGLRHEMNVLANCSGPERIPPSACSCLVYDDP